MMLYGRSLSNILKLLGFLTCCRPLCNIFSKKKTEHGMDLRKNEKYEVKFAKTNRLKNSSVPYMQRILNTDNLQFEKQELKNHMGRAGHEKTKYYCRQCDNQATKKGTLAQQKKGST